MRPARLDSASGLRPASAFVVIACVLTLVGIWVGRTSLQGGAPRSPWTRTEAQPEPEYTILDSDGRPLALFVQRLDLVMSPNAMWQSHTPQRMATAIAGVLQLDERELFDAMFPDMVEGVVEASFELDEEQAHRVDQWASHGHFDSGGGSTPVEGLWVQWSPRAAAFKIHWAPEVLLSEAARERHGMASSPLRWTRTIADGLAEALWGEAALGPGDPHEEREDQRQDLWHGLLPTTHAVVARDFPADLAPELLRTLDREAVAHHQMSVEHGRNRVYPAGRLPLLGGWGFVDPDRAESMALAELGFDERGLATREGRDEARAALGTGEVAYFDAAVRSALARRHPLFGLERACDRMLADPAWEALLDRSPATYLFQRFRAVRQRARSYYVESAPSSQTPNVLTTLDVPLQRHVGRVLDGVMDEHGAALAMAIVVDVASGDVLALASREAYEYSGLAPLYHEFTPGSTFKPIVMACALEEGVVRPHDTFDVGTARAYPIPGRIIHEAESSKTGVLTAAECLAHSVNAGMVQIGTQVPAESLRARLRALHYGERPGSGLGGERGGYVAALPWRTSWTHASVTFGHELSVTLWQHAAALATIARGGDWLPLRIVCGVEQSGRSWELQPPEPEPVFSLETCLDVREMMMLGAVEGTGQRVAGPEVLPGVIVGTKTGTPQKVPSEVCGHLEMGHRQWHKEQGTPCSKACRATLKGAPTPHRSCYTPSMCIFGRLEGTERELLVLVVVDEPKKGKFGGDVAGPAAVAIFKEALGLTSMGEEPVLDLVEGFAPADAELVPVEAAEQPWAEAGW
jgi:cell division protein FtsI/penicillin-binding protein 2